MQLPSFERLSNRLRRLDGLDFGLFLVAVGLWMVSLPVAFIAVGLIMILQKRSLRSFL